MTKQSVLVTGASGFIGRGLVSRLARDDNLRVTALFRANSKIDFGTAYSLQIDLTQELKLRDALLGVDCLIHCAGRAHAMNDLGGNELAICRAINVDATRRLSELAASCGVRRFIFLSSIKANIFAAASRSEFETHVTVGSLDSAGVFSDDATDPYGLSKLEAERALSEVAARTGLEVIILRLPLVYGPNVKGNLANLIQWIQWGLPLPFGGINNKRSMIGLDNLIDIIIRCLDCQLPSGITLNLSDGDDLSTPELVSYIADAMGTRVRLIPVPQYILEITGDILKRRKEIDRLTGTLRVDNSYAREMLNWSPSTTVEEGIRRMVGDR